MLGTLDDLAGQGDAAKRIRAALASGRLHHALLFAGPDGVGKFRAARMLAQVLMCGRASEADRTAGRPCGACPSCVRVAEGGHPDIHVLERDPEKRMIVVDAVREAARMLYLRPSEGPLKVMIIREADEMNPQAQNALLKTLEEPPGASRLILTSARPAAIIVTVLSRCQRISFRPVPSAEIARLLVSGRGLPEHTAALVAALAQGSPARAFETDPELVTADRDRMAELDRRLSPFSGSSVPDAIRSAVDLTSEKDDLRERLGLLGVWIRDQILVASGAREVELANIDRRADIEVLARERGLECVLGRARALHEARRLLDEPYNYNPTMIVEQMCLAFAGHAERAA